MSPKNTIAKNIAAIEADKALLAANPTEWLRQMGNDMERVIRQGDEAEAFFMSRMAPDFITNTFGVVNFDEPEND